MKYGPLSLEEIVSFAEIDKILLMKQTSFLIEQGLARKDEKSDADIIYTITERGLKTLRFFQNPELPKTV